VKPDVSILGQRLRCDVRTKTDPVHPVHVHIRSEEPDSPIFASISLHPFEPNQMIHNKEGLSRLSPDFKVLESTSE
jgi:hypothetical protein